MTFNLFSQRLIYAKRELTALKTARERNASLMKIYESSGTVTPPSDGNYTLEITVHFTSDYAPYPFFNFRTKAVDFAWSDSGSNISVEMIDYTDNGHSMLIQVYYSVTEGYSNDFEVTSTAPIINITYNWSEV
jgi:hypothetical protein